MIKIISVLLLILIFQSINADLLCESVYRTIDGSCNNLQKVNLGKSGNFFSRYLEAEFEDDISVPVNGPNARNVSNILMFTNTKIKNSFDINMLESIYAQFKNHDFERNLFIEDLENDFRVETFPGDVLYNASASNNFVLISFSNGTVSQSTGQFEIYNNVSSWSDLSQIYGSTKDVSDKLRTFIDGKLKTSTYFVNLGPTTSIPLFNLPPSQAITGLISNTPALGAPSNTPTSGDDRVNENIGLFAMTTIYIREHNRIASLLKSNKLIRLADGTMYNVTVESNLTRLDETLFQEARRRLIAQDQKILFEDYVPIVLHEDLDSYKGYKPNEAIDTPIEFSTGAFRYGHSSIANYKLRNLSNCIYNYTIPAGVLGPFPIISSEFPNAGSLGGFFSPSFATFTAGGLDNVIMGLLEEKGENVDILFSEVIRTIKFIGSIGSGIDLGTFDIMRGRFNGLPNYHSLRRKFFKGENRNIYSSDECKSNRNKPSDQIECFLLINPDINLATKLRNLYGKVNKIDGLVGLLAEYNPDKFLPNTITNIIKDFYQRIRDGDRFYYENDQFSFQELMEIKARTLSDIIRDNTGIKNLQDNAFQVQLITSSGNRC